MKNHIFLFIAGLHKSGTSLLHELLRDHPEISGFSDTGVPEDEGQHLQTVFKPDYSFGGLGSFVFDKCAYMDETHPLATEKIAGEIFDQWKSYYDLECKYLIEKSPPNIIRTRYLQNLFPSSKFIIIIRHPLVTAFATKKIRKTSSILSLLEHSLRAYEIFLNDMEFLNSVYVLRYEDLTASPKRVFNNIINFIGLGTINITREVHNNINDKYLLMWENDRKNWITRIIKQVPRDIPDEFEKRANTFGYSINNKSLFPAQCLGAHNKN